MSRTTRPAITVAALALSTSPLLLAVPAAADTSGGTKAGIEYAERLASGGDRPTKAQIERDERSQAGSGSGSDRSNKPEHGTTVPTGADSGAAAWQLVLSAGLGAVVAGGVLAAGRQVSSHRHPVASAH